MVHKKTIFWPLKARRLQTINKGWWTINLGFPIRGQQWQFLFQRREQHHHEVDGQWGDNQVSGYAAGIDFYDGCLGEVVQLAYELCEMLEVSVGDFGLVVDWKDCRSFNLMLLSRRLALLYFCFVPKSDTENPLSNFFGQIQVNNQLPTICPRSSLRYDGASHVESQQYCQHAYCT
jgi:hypothetical protein